MSDEKDKGKVVVSPQEYETEVEAVVREELTVLARSLSARISWRLGTQMSDPRPGEAKDVIEDVTDDMIRLMSCYGFATMKGEE